MTVESRSFGTKTSQKILHSVFGVTSCYRRTCCNHTTKTTASFITSWVAHLGKLRASKTLLPWSTSLIRLFFARSHEFTFLSFVLLIFLDLVLLIVVFTFLFQEVVGYGEFKVGKINILRLLLPGAARVFTLWINRAVEYNGGTVTNLQVTCVI